MIVGELRRRRDEQRIISEHRSTIFITVSAKSASNPQSTRTANEQIRKYQFQIIFQGISLEMILVNGKFLKKSTPS